MVQERTYDPVRTPELRVYGRIVLTPDIVDLHVSEEGHIHEWMQQNEKVCTHSVRLERELTAEERLAYFQDHPGYDAIWIENEEIERCMANDGGFVRYHLIGLTKKVEEIMDQVEQALQ